MEIIRDAVTLSGLQSDPQSLNPNNGPDVDETGVVQTHSEPNVRCSSSSLSETASSGSKSLVSRKSSFLSSVMQVADKHAVATSASRPMSAPTRSSPNMASGGSATLPSQSNVRLVRDKQLSEYKKRRANIEEGARAAFQYSAKRQSLKALSLPRGHKSPSLSTGHSTSTQSNEDALDRNFSSPAVMDNTATPVHSQDEHTPSGDHKLTNTSVSVDGGFQIEQIWKEVATSEGHPTVAESTTSRLPLSNGHCGGGDEAIEEKDIVLGFEDSHPQSATRASLQYDSPDAPQVHRSTLPRSNEEKAKHRTSSFSNKRRQDAQLRMLNISYLLSTTEIESLLLTLRSLSARDDEVKELNILEGMLKSNTFKRAKQVSH